MVVKKLVLAAALVAVGTVGALANDIILLRQQIMKTNGQAAKTAIGLIRGDIPWDPALAAAVALNISHDNEVFISLFPAGTETGDNTTAAPTIWSDAAGFKAITEKIIEEGKAAAAAAANGKDAFAAAFTPVGATCAACHQTYRKG